MLQQTQVTTVEPYYRTFMARWPTVEDLAAAREHDVLRLWEGLGYYRRAQQLHRAARQIVHEHGGAFPRDWITVRNLPGIGRYTAGAVLSIAFGLRHPILEANSQRLLSRLIAYRKDPLAGDGQRLLWQLAETLLPRHHVGLFNQSLMELGNRICTVRAPTCPTCPLKTVCATNQQQLQAVIPYRKMKKKPTKVREAVVAVYKNRRLLLRQYPEGERWAQLWDFPRFPLDAVEKKMIQQELVTQVKRLTGIEVDHPEHLTTIQHSVTCYRITLLCHEAKYLGGRINRKIHTPIEWIKPIDLANYPLTATGRRFVKLLTLA